MLHGAGWYTEVWGGMGGIGRSGVGWDGVRWGGGGE